MINNKESVSAKHDKYKEHLTKLLQFTEDCPQAICFEIQTIEQIPMAGKQQHD